MNILLINHYAGSTKYGMEFRPFYLGKKWIEKGHNVTILAASFSHLRKKQPIVNKNFTTEIIDGIKYVWIKTPEYQGNGMARIKNILSFVKTISKNAKKIAQDYNPDAVIASSTYPVDIKPAHKIAKYANANLSFEIHDLWPLSPMELGGYSKFHPFIVWLQYYENYAFKHVDKVISILPKTLEHCTDHGLKPEKWNYVPNGIFLDDWNNSASIPVSYTEKLDSLKKQGFFLVAYTGNIGIANVLNTFIESKKFLNDKKIAIILLGTGSEKDNLKQLSKNFNDVYFFEPIEKNAIPNFLKKIDVVYIGLKKQPLFRFGVSPNKIFDYMMAAKPIINAVEAGNDLIQEANAGISIEPENPKAIAGAILKLVDTPEQKLIEMGQNGRKFVLENHEYSVLADKFLNVIEKSIN